MNNSGFPFICLTVGSAHYFRKKANKRRIRRGFISIIMEAQAQHKRRLFVSIDLESREARESIKALIGELKRDGLRDASFVPPENIHLSMKFLGDVPESRMSEVTECIEKACTGTPPFKLRIEGFGSFPEGRPLRFARVLFVKAVAEKEGLLENLAGRLSSEFAARGIGKRDNTTKPFTPHITIARIRRPPADSALPALEKTMQRNENVYIGAEAVNSVCLKESSLAIGRPPMYETRFRCELKD